MENILNISQTQAVQGISDLNDVRIWVRSFFGNIFITLKVKVLVFNAKGYHIFEKAFVEK